jgi:hypothetical protein
MTLYEIKRKYLSLIEELNPGSEQLTDDPDIAAKQNEVVNQVMFELCRMKKIARYTEIPVKKGQVIEFADIEKKVGNEIFQIEKVCGVNFQFKANGTVLKFLEDGVAEIDCFVFPERITEKTKDKAYEFELSNDVLEIMPYGIAADILMSDVSANYGKVYREEFERKLQRLDSRNQMGSIFIDGGVSI